MNDVHVRACVHEAGHAIVAWSSACVDEVVSVRYERPNGYTDWQINAGVEAVVEAHWERCAIRLAGLAAEEVILGNVEPKYARDDMMHALRHAKEAERLATCVNPMRSWGRLSRPNHYIPSAYDAPMSDYVSAVLHTCYSRAVVVCRHHERSLRRLGDMLHRHLHLDTVTIQKTLGPRPTWA